MIDMITGAICMMIGKRIMILMTRLTMHFATGGAAVIMITANMRLCGRLMMI
ncbi:hypothetical protein ANACOL_01882 [Anaerotruncus colihominis DSM 17241]|uniref:Uncharacterized protein n=1 Tax=Anaerotruncus colihominis DSM 17241 TaxID=445972 RepID=B0PAT2_9FIRM|nr:hypothetical protein ANACOL_01882 [Anaerotruncus colihominis DSM 17241]